MNKRLPVLAALVLFAQTGPAKAQTQSKSPKVTIQQIFLQNLGKKHEERNEYRRRLLEGILKRVLQGDDFAALARGHSDAREPLGRKGQPIEVDFFGLDPAVQEAVRHMVPGQVSPMIETATGIQIIRLVQIPSREDLIPPPTPTPTPTLYPGPIPPRAGVVGSATFPLHVRFGEVSWDERTGFIQLSPLSMVPANADMPFVRNGEYLYALVKPATFYVPVEPPHGSEIIGFMVRHRDLDPESSVVASLWASWKNPVIRDAQNLIPPRLIGRVHSDMPGMPHIHQPGGSISERVRADMHKYYVEIVLNSGDDRQMVFGGHVAYTFEGPGGQYGASRKAWTVTYMGVPAKVPVWARPTVFPGGTPTPTPKP